MDSKKQKFISVKSDVSNLFTFVQYKEKQKGLILC